jgi:hypothetical protein
VQLDLEGLSLEQRLFMQEHHMVYSTI